MADTAQAQTTGSAATAGTTSASPLTSTSTVMSSSAQQSNVLPPQVPGTPVDPSAVPVPPHANEPTPPVPPEAAEIAATPLGPFFVPDKPSVVSSAVPNTPISLPSVNSSAMSNAKQDVPKVVARIPIQAPARIPIQAPSSVVTVVTPDSPRKFKLKRNLIVYDDKIEDMEDTNKVSVDKIDDLAESMEIQQTDSQSLGLTTEVIQEKCGPEHLKDDSKQNINILASSLESRNILESKYTLESKNTLESKDTLESKKTLESSSELDLENKLLYKTNEFTFGTKDSRGYNVNTEKTVENVATSVTLPVEKSVDTLETIPKDYTATTPTPTPTPTPSDSQKSIRLLQEPEKFCKLQSEEKVLSSGVSNESFGTNSLVSNESNILEGISKVSNETESLALSKDTAIVKDLLRTDDGREINEKTVVERQNKEIVLSESMSAAEGKVCNNIELDKNKVDGCKAIMSLPTGETGVVSERDDSVGGLVRNMENQVTSWAGDAEGDTAMSATTTTPAATEPTTTPDKEDNTNKMEIVEKDTTPFERNHESETENTELRNFSSITQLVAQEEENKIVENDSNSSDLNLSKQSLENNEPVEAAISNGPASEDNNEIEDDAERDVPSLEDIESTLDEVNQSQGILGVDGCTSNENAIEAATSLEPVTIGSAMQPIEESMEAHSIGDSSEVFNTETMALIESSADEDSSCVGGLVINSVVGAAEALAQFPPDEEDTEQTGSKELMDISISGPTNEEEEEGPAAKRLRLENGVEDPGKKLLDSDVKNVLLKMAPIKNGHGLWDAAKLKELLHNKGSILLRLHLSPDVAEANSTEDHNQDLSAIMIEVKDDDHIMGLSHLDSDADYDPLAMSIVEHMSPMVPGSGRGRGTSGTPGLAGVGRSTSLQPAVPHAPGFQLEHLYDLEFEDPQHMGSNSSAWTNAGMDNQGYQHDQVHHHQVYQHDPVHRIHHQGYHHQVYQHEQVHTLQQQQQKYSVAATVTPPKKLPSISKSQQKELLNIEPPKGEYPNPNSSRPLRYPPGSVTARGRKRGRPPLSYRNSFSPPSGRVYDPHSPASKPTTATTPSPIPPPAKVRRIVPPKPPLKFRAPTPPRNAFSSIKNTPKPSEIEARRAKLEPFIRQEEMKEIQKTNTEGPKDELDCPKIHAYKYMQLSTKVLKGGAVKLVCVFCQTVFRKKTALQGHIRYKHRFMQQCPICKENLNSKGNKYILRFHILKQHKDVPAYQCEKCPEAFKLEHHLKNHKRMVHKIQEEKSEESEATTTTNEETEEEEYEDRNHISQSGGDEYDDDEYDDIYDDEIKENLVEREIERIKRAREGELEKRDKRREEAHRILEQFEQQNRILEWEKTQQKIPKKRGPKPKIKQLSDLIKVPKKRGPKPKIKPVSDENLISDSSSSSKKPGPRKKGIESSAEEQTEQEKEEEEESGEKDVGADRSRSRGRGGGKRGRPSSSSTTAAATSAAAVGRRKGTPQKSKVLAPSVTATPLRKRGPPLRRDIGRTLRLESRRRQYPARGQR